MVKFTSRIRTLFTSLPILVASTQAWVLSISSRSSSASSACQRRVLPLNVCSVHGQRIGQEIPILDIGGDSELAEGTVIPLPSTHLPDEMTTLNVYGMQLTRPVHKLIVDDALTRSVMNDSELNGEERVFGQIVYKPDPDSLVGAIGCTAEVLLVQPKQRAESPKEKNTDNDGESTEEKTVLVRGAYRFRVKEIVKTIPFPVAIVDELCDDDDGTSILLESELPLAEEEEDDDDDETSSSDDGYSKRCLTAMRAYLEQQLDATARDMTPLEQSIIEDTENGVGMSAQKEAAEEALAVYEVFDQYIVDLCPTPTEMYFSIAFMAAEMANLENDARRNIIRMTNGVERLKYVTKLLEDLVGMTRARKMANSITEEVNESSKDLQVGSPELPPWSKSITKDTKLEYFWNEIEGWCKGRVVEEPMLIVDELILTVEFEDGETHRLPFTAEEKVRWRPPQPDEA